jgi:hypothetical protein
MPPNAVADIFLSYKSDDRTWAEGFAALLARHGWSVFWDREIPIGTQFDTFIEGELDAARCVIVLWSARSIVSSWVKQEAQVGFDRNILYPVLIENVQIPLGFRGLQTARLVDWQPGDEHPALQRLLLDVGRALGEVQQAVELRPEPAGVVEEVVPAVPPPRPTPPRSILGSLGRGIRIASAALQVVWAVSGAVVVAIIQALFESRVVRAIVVVAFLLVIALAALR